VDFLEVRNERQGLNLTFEVRDGILNHPSGYKPATLEGQIVSISDRIAYINHDIDDAVRGHIITKIPDKFLKNLRKCPHAVEYLFSRKINSDVIKSFGIGYAIDGWDNLLNYLKNEGYKEEAILKTGLIIWNDKNNTYYDRFRNRIIFPIFDIKKRIIGFGGRVLDDSMPKYLNSPESLIFNKGYNLYGLNIAKENIRNNSFILVEGYMDGTAEATLIYSKLLSITTSKLFFQLLYFS
jgi:DNA primase catalytic core